MKTGHENRQRAKEASALRTSFVRRLACSLRGGGLAMNASAGRRGQQTLEYAVFIGVVSLALLVMYMYTRRGLQAVIKVSADQIGPQADSVPQWSVSSPSTNSETSTLADETMHINKIGGASIYDTGSYAVTTGTSTIWSEEIQ